MATKKKAAKKKPAKKKVGKRTSKTKRGIGRKSKTGTPITVGGDG